MMEPGNSVGIWRRMVQPSLYLLTFFIYHNYSLMSLTNDCEVALQSKGEWWSQPPPSAQSESKLQSVNATKPPPRDEPRIDIAQPSPGATQEQLQELIEKSIHKATKSLEDEIKTLRAELNKPARLQSVHAATPPQDEPLTPAPTPAETQEPKPVTFQSSVNETVPAQFKRYDKVAIVTKIHGLMNWDILKQSMCLLHHAYNNRVLYPIVVFTSEDIPQANITDLEQLIAPAKLTVAKDSRSFEEEVAALSPRRREALLEMCQVNNTQGLEWWSRCGPDKHRLNYNWQAEFRSLHLWHHPALKEYKTMFWLDADGFCTTPWTKDPVEYFIENQGVMMFDHFPMGQSKYTIQPKVLKGFNTYLCELALAEEGHLVPKLANQCVGLRSIPNIHGFFHITDLDFYRSEPVKRGLNAVFEDCFLCRFPDDQLAVTLPAAILAPEKSWEMRSKGFHLNVFHNSMMDGIDQAKPAGFLKYWDEIGRYSLPTADGVCPITAVN